MDQDEAMRLFVEQRAPLLGFLRAIVGSRERAEDLLQDLAVLLLRKHADIPNPEAFPGWIRRAARFEARNAMRRVRAVELDEAALDALEAAWAPAWAGGKDGGEDVRIAALERCLAGLSPTARRLVELRYRQGLDCAALAERLGRPLNTVYVGLSRLHRALEDCIRGRLAQGGRS